MLCGTSRLKTLPVGSRPTFRGIAWSAPHRATRTSPHTFQPRRLRYNGLSPPSHSLHIDRRSDVYDAASNICALEARKGQRRARPTGIGLVRNWEVGSIFQHFQAAVTGQNRGDHRRRQRGHDRTELPERSVPWSSSSSTDIDRRSTLPSLTDSTCLSVCFSTVATERGRTCTCSSAAIPPTS